MHEITETGQRMNIDRPLDVRHQERHRAGRQGGPGRPWRRNVTHSITEVQRTSKRSRSSIAHDPNCEPLLADTIRHPAEAAATSEPSGRIHHPAEAAAISRYIDRTRNTVAPERGHNARRHRSDRGGLRAKVPAPAPPVTASSATLCTRWRRPRSQGHPQPGMPPGNGQAAMNHAEPEQRRMSNGVYRPAITATTTAAMRSPASPASRSTQRRLKLITSTHSVRGTTTNATTYLRLWRRRFIGVGRQNADLGRSCLAWHPLSAPAPPAANAGRQAPSGGPTSIDANVDGEPLAIDERQQRQRTRLMARREPGVVAPDDRRDYYVRHRTRAGS